MSSTDPAREPAALSERERAILKDIIQTHVDTGRPVSSRTLSKHAQHGLSAASIRNIMADLEEAGYLMQPHTSAGRVPTTDAYRVYVRALMRHAPLGADEASYIEHQLFDAAIADVDQLMTIATHLLSEMSSQVGVVLTPAVGDAVLRRIEFVRLGAQRILCVLVSATGFVDHIVIDVDEPIDDAELVRIANYVNDRFNGLPLRTIRDRLMALMSEERTRIDHQLARTIRLARRAVAHDAEPGVLVEGTTTLIGQPELADVVRIRRMLDTFADQARLVGMLNRCLDQEGVRVLIGDDSEVTSEFGLSLVAVPYGVGERQLGSLGIIGPSRMEYARVIALVHHLGRALSAALTIGSRQS
ncbi:MAG: heat-inducible transcriptional repressor HrcA [Acidobacteriota bacterium]